MNAFGGSLIWAALQVTVFVSLGIGGYLLARRRGPAAGSSVALLSLLLPLAITAFALAPWPVWTTIARSNADNRAATGISASTARNSASSREPGSEPRQPKNQEHNAASPKQPSAAADNVLVAGWTGFLEGLRSPSSAAPESGLRWPGIVAAVALGGVALALLRLLLGCIAVAHCRRKTRPITDAHLLQALTRVQESTALRTGVRTVEVRETAQIAAPATIGWRRPIVILPLEWRTWSEEELQAVLAHEVAHIQRGDYAAWLCAQVSVALHFYNPLVHWLSRRLRLEQEMAADQCGAESLGGRERYLAVLAAMALRLDNRGVAWAARPFLPGPSLFFRRIEMLRAPQTRIAKSFSRLGKILLTLLLILTALGVVGVRGPHDKAMNEVAAAPPEAAATNETNDLAVKFVPDDVAILLAVHPARLFARDREATKPILDLLQKEMKSDEQLGFPVTELDEFIVALAFDEGTAEERLRKQETMTILRSTKAQNWKAAIEKAVPHGVEATASGEKYVKAVLVPEVHSYPKSDPKSAQCAYQPDDRTLIIATEARLLKILADLKRPTAHTWEKNWQRVSHSDMAAMFNCVVVRPLVDAVIRPLQNQDVPMSLIFTRIFSVAGPLWKESQDLSLGVNLNQKCELVLFDEFATAAAAEESEKTAQALLTLAGNALSDFSSTDIANDPPRAPLMKGLNAIVANAKLSRTESLLSVESRTELFKLDMLGSLAAPMQGARERAIEAASMNNLKQINIALLTYKQEKGKFPASALLGPDGKTPHSWRVELLPYLGAVDLYKEYDQNQPWDSAANKKVLAKMPPIYQYPSPLPETIRDITNASYYLLVGGGTVVGDGKGPVEKKDSGGANRIVIVESARDIPWTKPEDIEYVDDKPLPKFGGFQPNRFNVGFADGSVRTLDASTKESELREFITGPKKP